MAVPVVVEVQELVALVAQQAQAIHHQQHRVKVVLVGLVELLQTAAVVVVELQVQGQTEVFNPEVQVELELHHLFRVPL